MTSFQIAGIVVSGLMSLVSLKRLISSPGRRVVQLFWLILWTASVVAFVFPDGTTVIAQTLGIERGADMVLYSAVLASSMAFWLVSLRLREQGRQITQLSRKIAIAHARPPAADEDLEPR
jgi:small membrane protein